MKNIIRAIIRGELGKQDYPEVGTPVDDIYTVILCPVCGHKTLDNYYVCCHCGWEYDGFSGNHFSSANGTTLTEYREEYSKIIAETEKKNNV